MTKNAKCTITKRIYLVLGILFKWAIPGLIFFIFVVLIVNSKEVQLCLWLHLNCGPLVSKVTALPTEPQPLPKGILCSFTKTWNKSSLMHACLPAPNAVVEPTFIIETTCHDFNGIFVCSKTQIIPPVDELAVKIFLLILSWHES